VQTFDPYTIQTRYVPREDGTATLVRFQHVGAVVDVCKELHNSGMHGTKGTKHVASVPSVVIEHYCNTHQITLREFMQDKEHKRRLLNSPEFADFRVWPGKV